MKSYNIDSLMGDIDYDDTQFQSDYRKLGIEIPDSLLYTPELNQFVASQERDRTKSYLPGKLNPQTRKPFTQEEADIIAEESYAKVMSDVDELIKQSK